MALFHYIENDLFISTGSSPYENRLCLQDNNGPDTSNSQSVKGDEELSRVYQTLNLPTLSREDNASSNNRYVL